MSGQSRATGPFFRTGLLLAALGLAAFVPALAANGTVVDVAGEPIVGARVCYIKETIALLCSETDAQGRFELPNSGLDELRADADGYDPVVFSDAAQDGAVILELAPALLVRLIDRASGERIAKGEVFVVFPTGKKKGPFPTNPAGVRVRRGLPPGEIRVFAKAEGYEDSQPRSVTLERGRQAEVELELDALPEEDAGE